MRLLSRYDFVQSGLFLYNLRVKRSQEMKRNQADQFGLESKAAIVKQMHHFGEYFFTKFLLNQLKITYKSFKKAQLSAENCDKEIARRLIHATYQLMAHVKQSLQIASFLFCQDNHRSNNCFS